MGGNGNGTYNALGWLTQRIDVVSDTEFYRYSRDGELRRSTNRRSQTIEYIYDVLHRPTSKSGTNTATETYAYPSDTVLVATSPVAVDTLLSNRNGQLLRVGRHYVWDMQLGSLVNIGLGSAATSIQHDRDAMLSGIVFPGGDAVSRTSNSVHTTADLTTTAPYSATVNRSAGIDAANRIQRQITSTTAGHQYTYDGLGRLRSDSNVVSSGGTPCDPHNPPSDSGDPCTWGPAWLVQGGVSFSYDSAGNRRDLGGSYAWGNRIRAFDGCSYATDSLGDGNVTRRICGTDTVTFTWTAENRLASLTSAGQTTTFDYNAAGQLVRMSKPGHVRQFLWERDNLLPDRRVLLLSRYGQSTRDASGEHQVLRPQRHCGERDCADRLGAESRALV